MGIFKKLFGSSDKADKKYSEDNNNILDTYKNIPWMTDTRLDNVSTCLNAGFKPASSLPTEFDRQLRSSMEIAQRLNAIKALVLWLMVDKEELPNETILDFVNTNKLESFMNAEEKQILKASRDDEELRNMIGWKFENAWPLAWYFGYVQPQITGEMMTGEQMQDILIDFTCPLDEKIEDWLTDKKFVAEESIIKMEDLFYCIHNAVRSAQLGHITVPSDFDPILNGGVIHERRHALTWMLSKGTEWDDTDLST